jgi:hypothetical protein
LTANSCAHPPLDAVAVHSFAQCHRNSQPNADAAEVLLIAIRRRRNRLAPRRKPSHQRRPAFARNRIGALIVRVLLEENLRFAGLWRHQRFIVAYGHEIGSNHMEEKMENAEAAPRRNPRWLWTTLAVLAILVVAGAGFVLFHKQSAPRAVRLLPESDGLVYVNLAAVREATQFDRKPLTPDPEYQAFVAGSGVQLEHDLDQAAFAVHRLDNPLTAQGPFAYSEVFVGHFDRTKLTAYLASQASGTEDYAGHTIYSVPHEDRIVRVAVLDRRSVAISNTTTPEQIHAIIDHDRQFYPTGPTLLQDHYRDVPVFSFAWGLGKIAAPLTGSGDVKLFGFRIPLPTNTIFVASARYLGWLSLRIDEFAPNESVAETSAALARTVVAFYKGEQSLRGKLGGESDTDMAEMLKSVKIEQTGDHATLEAKVPVNLVRRLATP